MENAITVNNSTHTPFESVTGIWGMPARKTGCISMVIQSITLVVSSVLVMALFLHIGGYNKLFHKSTNVTLFTTTSPTMQNNIDETILILNDTNEDVSLLLVSSVNSEFDGENSTTSSETTILDTSTDVEEELIVLLNKNNSSKKIVYHGPFEQIHDAILKIGRWKIDLLSTLRGSCIFYMLLCIIWFFSIFALLASLKFEIIDLVFINTFILAMVTTFIFIQAILIGILLFYQYQLRWKTLLIISFTVGGLLLCFVFNIFAFCLSIKWIRYIDYMNGWEESCIFMSTIVRCIKRHAAKRHHNNERSNGGGAPADYSIPEATRHSNLPYIDDPPVQQFSNF